MAKGYKYQTWTDELDYQLIHLIARGKNLMSISSTMKMSIQTIQRRLKILGYVGIKDAREYLLNR